LRAVLGDALFADVAAAYKALGLSEENLDSRRPWAVINTLAVYSSAVEMGIRDVRTAVSLGVETAVLNYATAHRKQFAYLESIDEISDTMESFSDALNRYLLEDEIDVILNRKPVDAESIAQWPQWWRDGNAGAFRDYYRSSFQGTDEALYAEYKDKLVTQRNALMAGRLDAMFKEGGTYFVTVGLLHLVSQDGGIPALLEAMGYTVEQAAQE
jgi:uncharacterized protein